MELDIRDLVERTFFGGGGRSPYPPILDLLGIIPLGPISLTPYMEQKFENLVECVGD